MSQLRIIYDNAADSATLFSTSTAGSLVAANMKTNMKSRVWRSTGTSAAITAYLATSQPVNGVILAFTNLTPGALLQVTASLNDNVVYSSTVVMGNPPTPFGQITWGDPLGGNAYSSDVPLSVNNFAQGAYSYARLWFDSAYIADKIDIGIVDVSNLSGYLEVGKLIIGNSWSPSVGTEVGATELSNEDSTTYDRNDSGDLLSDIGTKHRVLGVNFPSLSAQERDKIWRMLRSNSKGKPIFLSAFSGDADVTLEQMFMIFGNISSTNSLGIPYSKQYFETDIEIEEI